MTRVSWHQRGASHLIRGSLHDAPADPDSRDEVAVRGVHLGAGKLQLAGKLAVQQLVQAVLRQAKR